MRRFDRGEAVSANPVSSIDPARLGEQARHALTHGEEQVVLPAITQAAHAVRSDASLWQWKGLLHLGLSEHEDALAAFEIASRLAPRDAKVAHARARTSLEAGLPAVDLFRQAYALAPSNGDVLLGLAAARCAAGERDAAIAELDALLVANPGWIPGHEAVCRLRWEDGERDGFARSLEEALARAPRDSSLWHSYVILLTHAAKWQATLEAIRRARSLLGDLPFLAANEAIALSESGDIAAADARYADLAGREDMPLAAHRLRHELRAGRPDRAAKLGETWMRHPEARLIWPYMGLAWRLLDDPRWHWLDGDPRLVSVIDLEISAAELQGLGSLLRSLHNAKSHGLDQSVRGGTQTDGPLLNRLEPEFRQLRGLIKAAVLSHVSQLPAPDEGHPTLAPRRDRDIRFAGSWSVRLSSQGHHANHIHPAGWISSAFYVALPGASERGAPPAGWLSLGKPQTELGLDLPPNRMVEPKPGRLVLFPSTMWHGTVPFDAGERLTVAFDVAHPLV